MTITTNDEDKVEQLRKLIEGILASTPAATPTSTPAAPPVNLLRPYVDHCTIKRCARLIQARGLCSVHYSRERRGVSSNAPERVLNPKAVPGTRIDATSHQTLIEAVARNESSLFRVIRRVLTDWAGHERAEIAAGRPGLKMHDPYPDEDEGQS